MLLHEILPLLPDARFDAGHVRRATGRALHGVSVDPRLSGPGMVFVSLPERARSNPFEACAAQERGASVVVRERSDPTGAPPGVLCIEVEDARRAYGLLASALHGHPSRRLVVLGVAGPPRWRERVAGLMAALLEATGDACAWFSGRSLAAGERRVPWDATVVEAGRLQAEMERHAGAGGRACVLELGTGALGLDAVHGVDFRMLREAAPGETGGLEAQRLSPRGTVARWEGPGQGRALLTPLVGRSQAAALGQALAWMRELGFDAAPLASAVASLAGLPGWMEPVTMGQRFGVLVDGADEHAALEEALADARELATGRGVVVTGPHPGLGRDEARDLARAAGGGADDVVVTSDDLSGEAWQERGPEFASWALAMGCTVGWEADRHRAVARALSMARPGDVVVLAGKGRRPVQVVGPTRMPWDDAAHARAALAAMGHVGGGWE